MNRPGIKPQSREPVCAKMRGLKGLAGEKQVEREEGKKLIEKNFLNKK